MTGIFYAQKRPVIFHRGAFACPKKSPRDVSPSGSLTDFQGVDMQNPTAPVNESRFWAKVDKSDTCWNWNAAILNGYGRFGVWREGKQRSGLAHRVAYELSGRAIPDGMFLDHMCHNKACVNPAHLRVVNNKQNIENHSGATSRNTSGVRGVSLHRPSMLWRAVSQSNGKLYNAGYFKTIPEAEAAVIALRNRLHTHNDADRVA